ncbi:MAG: DinB family protein, partial [Dehalococcoidia bacterium]|nr:DinB family protein [Dehalococcoidia bacterium]
MSTVEFIQRSLEFTHAALIDARNGTDEQLHFVPEQGSHSIAWCLWHTSRVEDLIISRVSDQSQVWSEEWARDTGLPFDGFGTGMSDEDARQVRVADIAALAGYQDAVFERTARFLAAATDEDLQREIPARNGTESVGEAISLHIFFFFYWESCEIYTLRGMQGM